MKVKFKKWNCIAVGKYYNPISTASKSNPSKKRAILLYDEQDGSPVATATVNVDDDTLSHDTVYIKDYSENKGMISALGKAGIILPNPVKTVLSGYVEVQAYRLTKQALERLW